MEHRGFHARWVVANLAGSSLGFGVFAVLAHGLTSPHGEMEPSAAQVVAHTLGLLPAGVIIALAQRLVLARHVRLARWFEPAMVVAVTAGFLVGAYGIYPPFDFLLAYAAAGAVLDLALPSTAGSRGSARRAALMALLFASGSFLGMLALSLVARATGLRLGAPGEDVPRHVLTMVLGGLSIGAAIGLVSARRVRMRVLHADREQP